MTAFRGIRLRLIALVCAALVGCGSSHDFDTASVTVGVEKGSPRFEVEVAATAEQQRVGLGSRDVLSKGTGMLFVFGSRSEQQVWMAGMTFPLDIAWITDGRVVAIETLMPCTDSDESQCPRCKSPGPVDALLEVPARSLITVAAGMPVTVENQ